MKKNFSFCLVLPFLIFLGSCGKTINDVAHDRVEDLFNQLKTDSVYKAYMLTMHENTLFYTKSVDVKKDSAIWKNKSLSNEQKFAAVNSSSNLQMIKANMQKMAGLQSRLYAKYPLISQLSAEEYNRLSKMAIKHFSSSKEFSFDSKKDS